MLKPIIIFAFANTDHGGMKLGDLITELEGIEKINEGIKNYEFKLIFEATIAKVIDKINMYRDQIVGFHFAGHANQRHLLFQDKKKESATVDGSQLARVLGKLPNLEFVFLNGCSTLPLVKAFHDAGIPHVIATRREVEDALAAEFAVQFYREVFESGIDLRQAFEIAKDKAKLITGLEREIRIRTLREEIKINPSLESREFPWGLYLADDSDSSKIFLHRLLTNEKRIPKTNIWVKIGTSISLIFLVFVFYQLSLQSYLGSFENTPKIDPLPFNPVEPGPKPTKPTQELKKSKSYWIDTTLLPTSFNLKQMLKDKGYSIKENKASKKISLDFPISEKEFFSIGAGLFDYTGELILVIGSDSITTGIMIDYKINTGNPKRVIIDHLKKKVIPDILEESENQKMVLEKIEAYVKNR